MSLAFELPRNETVIISRTELNRLKSEEVNTALAGFYAKFKRVQIVDNVKSFFSNENILSLITGNSTGGIDEVITRIRLICEQRKISLTQHEMSRIIDYLVFLDHFKSILTESDSTSKTGAYLFAKVHPSFSLERKFVFTKNTIRMRSSYETLTIASAKQIWACASILWASVDENSTITNEDCTALYPAAYNAKFIISASSGAPTVKFGKTDLLGKRYQEGGFRYLLVQANGIRIGCSVFPRHEIEQIAKHLEFDFPK